jgi:hypothetical protein
VVHIGATRLQGSFYHHPCALKTFGTGRRIPPEKDFFANPFAIAVRLSVVGSAGCRPPLQEDLHKKT